MGMWGTKPPVGSLTEYTAPDGRTYLLYTPASYEGNTPLPLMLMLHGCAHDSRGLEELSGLQDIADREGFFVAFPEQTAEENEGSCWNWYMPEHQKRGEGEPESIVGVVNDIKSRFIIDSGRVYVQGFSAGGAMAVILGVTYPDVFTAIGVHAGLQYMAASSLESIIEAGRTGGPDPKIQGKIAYEQMGEMARVVPVIVWHGDIDPYVPLLNADIVIAQMAKTNDLAYDGLDNDSIDDVPDEIETGFDGKNYTRYIYKNSANDQVVMEKFIIEEMGHLLAGGVAGKIYASTNAPNSMELTWLFFKNYTK